MYFNCLDVSLSPICDVWLDIVSYPQELVIDKDTGFQKEFNDLVEYFGGKLKIAAGQAPWQHGTVERQGGLWKAMWNKTVAYESVGPQEIRLTAVSVSAAKNELRRKSGFSPAQWAFGRNPKIPGDLIDHPEDLASHSQILNGDNFKRINAIRTAARTAFIRLQHSEAYRRALVARPRVAPKHLDIGDYVFIYRTVAGHPT